MKKALKKVLAAILSLALVAAFTPALSFDQASADDTTGFTVTKSYVKTGTSEKDAANERVGTSVIKTYSQAEFEKLATVGDEVTGSAGPAYYMWTKSGDSYNVYKIHKGVRYDDILRDAADIEGKDAINALAGIYSYNDKDCTSLYGKLSTLKSQFLGATTYTYNSAKYNSAEGAVSLGEGTEVPGIMAISYDYSKAGLSADNADKTPAELTDWETDANRMFLGVGYDSEGKMITGGFMSQSNANTGIDVIEYYDVKVTFNGDENSAQYLEKDEVIDLPEGDWCYKAAPGYVKVKSGTAAGDISGESDVIDLKSMPSAPKVSATSTYNSVTLKWNKVDYADGYYVNGKDVGNKTTVKYTGLKTGKKYTYKVEAYHNFEDGSITSQKTVTAKPSLKKAVVKTAKNVKVKAIKTTWKKVTGAKKYQVSIAVKKSGTKVVKTTNKLSFKKTKLKKGKTYYVKVRAVASNGAKGKWSAVRKVKVKK